MHKKALLMMLVATLASSAPAGAEGPESRVLYEKGQKAFAEDDLFGAMAWLRRGADAGHAPSQALLAYILDRAEENQAALELYEKAAAQGDGDGLYGLAGMYAAGEGVERDDARALALYENAASRGHAPSQLVLAEAYLDSRLGLPRDPARAEALLREAASRSYRPAVERLARLTRDGASQ